jgi:carbon monoxide dehydrogenase subunit G
MPTLRNEQRIDATPDDVWRLLGDLESTPEWIPGVTEAFVTGDSRVCRTADGHEIRERIHAYDAGLRTWSYEQSVVPLPITGSVGTLAVQPDGDGARVEWEARFEVADGADEVELVPMIDGYYRQTLDQLRRRVEGETDA